MVPTEYVLHNRVYAMCKIAHYKFNACNSHAAHCFGGLTISSSRFVGIRSHFSFKDPPQYISSAKVWTLTLTLVYKVVHDRLSDYNVHRSVPPLCFTVVIRCLCRYAVFGFFLVTLSGRPCLFSLFLLPLSRTLTFNVPTEACGVCVTTS